MDISRLVPKFLLLASDILMCLGSREEIIEGLLVFLLVFIVFFGAWQLFDEEDVDYLNKFVLN